jgi:hypothetical protein
LMPAPALSSAARALARNFLPISYFSPLILERAGKRRRRQ